jgi:hypothetical protein
MQAKGQKYKFKKVFQQFENLKVIFLNLRFKLQFF